MVWLINSIGIALIFFIIYWFWLSKAKSYSLARGNIVEIIVADGAYNPAVIKVKKNKPFKLRFFRQDPTPCSEWVIFPKLDRNDQLPLNQPHIIELEIKEPGEYEFTCQMGMYRGKLIVL